MGGVLLGADVGVDEVGVRVEDVELAGGGVYRKQIWLTSAILYLATVGVKRKGALKTTT